MSLGEISDSVSGGVAPLAMIAAIEKSVALVALTVGTRRPAGALSSGMPPNNITQYTGSPNYKIIRTTVNR